MPVAVGAARVRAHEVLASIRFFPTHSSRLFERRTRTMAELVSEAMMSSSDVDLTGALVYDWLVRDGYLRENHARRRRERRRRQRPAFTSWADACAFALTPEGAALVKERTRVCERDAIPVTTSITDFVVGITLYGDESLRSVPHDCRPRATKTVFGFGGELLLLAVADDGAVTMRRHCSFDSLFFHCERSVPSSKRVCTCDTCKHAVSSAAWPVMNRSAVAQATHLDDRVASMLVLKPLWDDESTPSFESVFLAQRYVSRFHPLSMLSEPRSHNPYLLAAAAKHLLKHGPAIIDKQLVAQGAAAMRPVDVVALHARLTFLRTCAEATLLNRQVQACDTLDAATHIVKAQWKTSIALIAKLTQIVVTRRASPPSRYNPQRVLISEYDMNAPLTTVLGFFERTTLVEQ